MRVAHQTYVLSTMIAAVAGGRDRFTPDDFLLRFGGEQPNGAEPVEGDTDAARDFSELVRMLSSNR